jgi:hypothetical protein
MNVKNENPLRAQVGGAHYKNLAIQPIEFCHRNRLGACETLAIKYLCRWRDKGGLEDLHKAIHVIEILVRMETDTPTLRLDVPDVLRQWP